MNPDVSVVIPAYNAGELLLEAIGSALDQTLASKEVIVVDDGSSDGTQERMERFRGRIRYIRFEQNRGPGAARNAGISASSGRYIALLDSDDLWMPTRLEVMVRFMDAHPEFSFATTDAYFMFDDQPTTRSLFSVPLLHFTLEDQDVRIMRSNFVYNKLIFRRELFDKYGLYDESFVFEDWAKNMEFIMAGERCGFIDEALAYHRVVSTGSLTYRRATVYRDAERLLTSWLARDLRPQARRAALEALAESRWTLLWTQEMAEDSEGSKRILATLRRHGPLRFRSRAWLATLVGMARLRLIRKARFDRLYAGGGHWALDEGRPHLIAGDDSAARKHVVAAVLFAFPIKIRLAALGWIVFPPARRALGRFLARTR